MPIGPLLGRKLATTSTDIYRIAEGKIAEQWYETDTTSMMQQLGAVPNLLPFARPNAAKMMANRSWVRAA
ncbi:MAG TPA: ester cyclase [Anaerolineae bacterium]